MEPPVMGAVEWQAQVQHIVQGGQGTYGTCGQQTTVQMGACCAGNPGANHAWLGPELQTPQAMYYSPGPGMGMGSMEVPPHQVILPTMSAGGGGWPGGCPGGGGFQLQVEPPEPPAALTFVLSLIDLSDDVAVTMMEDAVSVASLASSCLAFFSSVLSCPSFPSSAI